MMSKRTHSIHELAEALDKRFRRHRRWCVAVTCLSAVVAFVTVYLLVLPAVTLESTVDTPGITVNHEENADRAGQSSAEVTAKTNSDEQSADSSEHDMAEQNDGTQGTSDTAAKSPVVQQESQPEVLSSALDEVIAEGTMANREGKADAISWSLVRDDRDFVTLTVEGTGGIPDGNNQPWMSAARNVVTDIVIGKGITYVGTNAFSKLHATGGLTLPSTLTSVGTWTFEYNDFSKPITVPGSLKTVGQGMFYNCPQIPSITFEEGVEHLNGSVLRSAVAMDGTVTLPSTLLSTGSEDFHDCMAGTYVVTGQESGDTTFFVQDGVLFKHNDDPAGTLTLVRYPKTREAEEYVVPDKVTSIEKWAFRYTHGLQRLVIPDSVSSVTIDSESFRSSTLTSVYFGAGVTFPNGINDLFNDARVLVDVEFSDKIANYGTTFQNVFITCPSLLKGIIPSTITSIDGNAFNTCRAMGTLVYDARNVTSFPSTFGAGYLSYELVIGGNVEHIGAGFDVIASYATGMTFTPNTSLTVEAGAFASLPAPLSRLSDARYADDAGNIHLTVDSQGAVYRLDPTKNEAMLVYCPPEVADAQVTALTVPGELTVEGKTYTVVGVGESSLLRASNLTSVTFDAPEKLQLLESNALANCPTLTSVNGKTTAREVQELLKKANSKVIIGYGAFSNTGLKDSLPDADFDKNMKGPESLTVSGTGEHATAPKLRLSVDATSPTISWPEGATTGGYTLLTGDTLKVDAAVGSVQPGHTYRVFLHFTEEGGELSNLEPGKTMEFEGVEARCYATVDPYTYCVEFTLEEGITTVSVPIWSIYHSPSTGGGGLLMWGEIGDPYTEAQLKGGVVGMEALTASRPDSEEQYLYATWTTERNEFEVNKYAAGSGSVQLVSDGKGGATVSKDLVWRINYTKKDAPRAQEGYGEDYVSTYRIQDVVTLPEGMSWKSEVVKALQDGTYKVTFTSPDGGKSRIATVMAGSTRVISFSDGYQNRVPEGVNAILDTNDGRTLTTSLSYRNTNGSPMGTDENTFSNVTVTLYAEALAADLEGVEAGSSLEVKNTANSKINYHHSEPSTTTANSPIKVKADEGSLSVTTEGKPAADGTVYLGEDIDYTVTLANTGSLAFTGAEGESHRVEDCLGQYAYIRPEQLPGMFDEAAERGMEFSLRIDGAQLLEGGWKKVTSAVDGKSDAFITAGNSEADGDEYTLTITRDDKRTYHVSINGIETKTGEDLPALLRACGYDVTSSAIYTCVWEPANGGPLTLEGGKELSFAVPATVKSTFQALSSDIDADYYEEQNFSVANDVKLIVTAGDVDKNLSTDSVSHDFAREVELEKNYEVTREGDVVEGASLSNVNDRDVIDYTVALRHWGSGAYQNLPVIDKLTGAQVLLVPVDKNKDNEAITSKNPDIIKHGGVDYHLLSTPGTYKNVVVGAVSGVGGGPLWTAATVEVTEAGTTVSWYAHELPAESYELGLRYSALVDASLSGAASFSVGNTAQLNNKPGSNLYTAIKGGGAAVTFEKRVVSRRGAGPASDVLYDADTTVGVTRGGQVTYRLMMSNKNATSYTLTGGSIADALPNTYDAFAWERADIEVAYVTTTNEVVLANENSWDVSGDYDQDPQSSDPNQYYLRWGDDFSVRLPAGESLYAYVTLHYPTNDEWRAYVERADGRPVYNTFWVHALSSTVRHELSDPGYATLQKGVYGMSRNERVQTGYGERHAYANSNSARHGVIYYVALVNAGSKRLYVNDIYDKLPRGFTYESVDKDAKLELAPRNGINYTVVTAGGRSSLIENPLVSFNKEVTYKSATITASTSGAVDAGQNLTFHVSAGTGADAISFDEEREQYYLSKDEAIVFAVLANASADPLTTDPLATNTIAMPYTDITGSGVFAADSQEAETNGTSVNVKGFIDQTYTDTNDGSAQVSAYELDGEETLGDRYGFASPANEATWLLSSVSQQQGDIVPAVEVSVESVTPVDAGSSTPYNGSASAQDTLTFGIKAYNYGSNSLGGFVLTDILPENYEFTGSVYHDECYTADGKLQYGDDRPLFTFLSRDENGAKIQWRGGNGQVVDITLDGQWYCYDENLMMRLWKTLDGREVLQVWLGYSSRFIPFGGYAHFTVSAKNTNDSLVSTVYTNTASFMPMRQTFDKARSPEVKVEHGITVDNLANLTTTRQNKVLGMLANEEGKGVQASCSVNVYVGAATAASLSVSEDRVTGNSATADWANDQITLEGDQADEDYGALTYTLKMTNRLHSDLERLVFIDSLPRTGDVHPFGEVARGSEYNVYFANNPEVTVRVVSSTGVEQTLDPNQYTVEYREDAPKSFTEGDWSGESTDGWMSSPSNVRAMTTLRVVIKEGTVKLSDGSTVQVSFHARVADDAPASAVAWNSFGYHGLYGADSTFEAMPASVGVRTPSAPSVVKEIVSTAGTAVAVPEDTSFSFVVYEGDPLGEAYDTREELLAALDERRTYREFEVTVPKGQSAAKLSVTPVLSGDEKWVWTQGARYNVVELPGSDAYTFERFSRPSGTSGTGVFDTETGTYSFTYDREVTEELTCVNRSELWSLTVNKVNGETDKPLAGATFALYGPTAPATWVEIPDALKDRVSQTVTVGEQGVRYHLVDLVSFGDDSSHTWTGLTDERYYLLEVAAPEGYVLPDEGRLVSRPQGDTESGTPATTVEVKNYVPYALPKTGGAGRTVLAALGATLALGSVGGYLWKRRRE